MSDQQENDNMQFVIQRVYLKDLSFEIPNAPEVFQQQWEPHMHLDLSTSHMKIEENVYEVVLDITVTVSNKNSTAFLIEVKQAGIFTIQTPHQEQLDHFLGSFCPNILFPYARETISSQVIKGSFPQLVLSPINFDALYLQQLEEQKNNVETPVISTEVSH